MMSMMMVVRVYGVHIAWQYTKHNVICRDVARLPTGFLKVRNFLNANCANIRIKRRNHSNSRNLPFR